MRNPDERMRELERAAATGDAEARLALLRARAAAGELATLPPSDTDVTVALGEGDEALLWSGVIDPSNEWDLVEGVRWAMQDSGRTGTETRVTLLWELGDEEGMEELGGTRRFGTDLSRDLDFLHGAWVRLLDRSRARSARSRFRELYAEAHDLMREEGFGPGETNEALSYLVDFPEEGYLLFEHEGIPVDRVDALDYAIAAAKWLVSVREGLASDLEGRRRDRPRANPDEGMRELERQAHVGGREEKVRYLKALARAGRIPSDSEEVLVLARLGGLPRWLGETVFGAAARPVVPSDEDTPGEYLSELMLSDLEGLDPVDVPEARFAARKRVLGLVPGALSEWARRRYREGRIAESLAASLDVGAVDPVLHWASFDWPEHEDLALECGRTGRAVDLFANLLLDLVYTEEHEVPDLVVRNCRPEAGRLSFGMGYPDDYEGEMAVCVEQAMEEMGSDVWSFQPGEVEANVVHGGRWVVRGSADEWAMNSIVNEAIRSSLVDRLTDGGARRNPDERTRRLERAAASGDAEAALALLRARAAAGELPDLPVQVELGVSSEFPGWTAYLRPRNEWEFVDGVLGLARRFSGNAPPGTVTCRDLDYFAGISRLEGADLGTALSVLHEAWERLYHAARAFAFSRALDPLFDEALEVMVEDGFDESEAAEALSYFLGDPLAASMVYMHDVDPREVGAFDYAVAAAKRIVDEAEANLDLLRERREGRRNPGSDRKLRELQRAAASGDPEAAADLLRHRVRVGDLSRDRLAAAAFLGDPAAALATGRTDTEPHGARSAARHSRLMEIPGFAARAALAAARAAAHEFVSDPSRRGFPEEWPGDPEGVFVAVEEWLEDPYDLQLRSDLDGIHWEWHDAARELEEYACYRNWYGWENLAWALSQLAAFSSLGPGESDVEARISLVSSWQALRDLYSERLARTVAEPGMPLADAALRATSVTAEAIRRELVPWLLA